MQRTDGQMFCVRCKHDVIDCLCVDIDQRLASLCDRDGAMAPAARTNLKVRLLLVEPEGKDPH